MFLIVIGIVIGAILAVAIISALYIMSMETEEGDEWEWKRF